MKKLVVPLIVVSLIASSALSLYAQDFQPEPVSEYAEKSGPNTITFLSYPKYYTDSEGKLTPVVTDLVASKSPDWDFEVTTGIWTLRVKSDGTFQAEHAGNVFAYRLSQIGVGRGEGFQAFKWGEANWKNYQVIGDKIRWYDVFPDVDFIVRYIHDILKVDVIVKAELMNRIRAEVKKGSLNADDYLTARFEIPSVWITSETRLAGEKVDIYAERLDLQQPLEFVKDGKIVQRLRPVETYVLDEKGERIESADPLNEKNVIHTAQLWRLQKDAPGIAEMSANLGDLANAPEGDVDIDPSFQYPAFNYPLKDTCLLKNSPTVSCGAYGVLTWSPVDHVLLSWLIQETMIPSSCTIDSVTMQFYVQSVSANFTSQTIRSHAVPEIWEESATWNNRLVSTPTAWSNAGAINLSSLPTAGGDCSLSSAGWKEIVLTAPFNSYFPTNRSYIHDKGFILRMLNTNGSGYASVATKENADTTLRAKLYVTLKACSQGTAYYPFLKRKDGNVNTVSDRWFPIGTYFMLEATDTGHYSGWPSGNLVSMAQKSYGNYFNCINPLENVDERGKRSSPVDDIFVAHVYEFTSMLTKMDSIASLYGVD